MADTFQPDPTDPLWSLGGDVLQGIPGAVTGPSTPSVPQAKATPAKPSAPSTPSDEARYDKQMAEYRKEVATEGERERAAAQDIVSETRRSGEQQVSLAREFQASQQPFTEPPPHSQINEIMSGAPWMFALMAIGGKVSGAGGLAMMEGLNGMSSGLIAGDEAALNRAYEKYNANYERWKANSDQQYKVYQVLSTAYAGQSDANLRALTSALQVTNDTSQNLLKLDDPATYWTMKTKIEEAHARTTEAIAQRDFVRAKIKQLDQFGKPPSNYRWKMTPDGELATDETGRPVAEPIPGGPKDPKSASGSGMGSRAEQQFDRIVQGAAQATQEVQNIMNLPITVQSGWLGRPEKGSILDASKSGLVNAMTSQEVQDYQTMVTGIQRNLAAIEAAGLAPSGSLTHMMDAVVIQPGQSNLTKLRKMAQIRQIVEKGTELYLSSPKVSEPQKDYIRQIVSQMRKAVPYTQDDVTKLEFGNNPKTTIRDVMQQSGLAGAAETPPAGNALLFQQADAITSGQQ